MEACTYFTYNAPTSAGWWSVCLADMSSRRNRSRYVTKKLRTCDAVLLPRTSAMAENWVLYLRTPSTTMTHNTWTQNAHETHQPTVTILDQLNYTDPIQHYILLWSYTLNSEQQLISCPLWIDWTRSLQHHILIQKLIHKYNIYVWHLTRCTHLTVKKANENMAWLL